MIIPTTRVARSGIGKRVDDGFCKFVARNLRRLRLRAGLSQVELCRKARINRRGFQVVEAGLALPRLDSLVRICRALNIELGDVVKEYVDG